MSSYEVSPGDGISLLSRWSRVMKFSFTTIILLAFFAYVLNSVYVIYQLFNVPSCKGNSRKCLPPHRLIDENLEVSRARAP